MWFLFFWKSWIRNIVLVLKIFEQVVCDIRFQKCIFVIFIQAGFKQKDTWDIINFVCILIKRGSLLVRNSELFHSTLFYFYQYQFNEPVRARQGSPCVSVGWKGKARILCSSSPGWGKLSRTLTGKGVVCRIEKGKGFANVTTRNGWCDQLTLHWQTYSLTLTCINAVFCWILIWSYLKLIIGSI